MDKDKLKKANKKLAELRKQVGNMRGSKLKRFARSLGRRRVDRGKEPTYENPLLPDSRPISIPDHPGDLNRYTAGGILDQLEEDIFAFEELLSKEEE